MATHTGPGGPSPGLPQSLLHPDLLALARLPQVIVYVEDVNDEAPVFTQQQYSRLGLRETAGIGTSVIVVRATDRDTGEAGRWKPGCPLPQHDSPQLISPAPAGPVILRMPEAPRLGRASWDSLGGIPTRCLLLGGLESGGVVPASGWREERSVTAWEVQIVMPGPGTPCWCWAGLGDRELTEACSSSQPRLRHTQTSQGQGPVP